MENISGSTDNKADQVACSNDLLSEILRRLPVRSLLRFKSVSKHWYYLISSPSFKLLRHSNPEPPSGLFVPIQVDKPPYVEYEFVPLDTENPTKSPFETLVFDPNVKGMNIEHASNGLMLCHSQSVDGSEEGSFVSTHKYYVYNPTTNEFTVLPRVENYDNGSRFGMNLAFDPSKSPHYRVVYVCRSGFDYRMGESRYQIEIYCSETRTFKASCQFLVDKKMDMNFRGGVHWNNAIHWLHEKGFMLYFKFDDEKICHIQTSSRPRGLVAKKQCKYIFESRGCLLLVDIVHPLTSEFNIYELKRDYSGWSVKYHVDIDEVSGVFPEIVSPQCHITFEFAILSLVLGEREEDSFLVLKIPGKAVRYNLVLKTFYKLYDFTARRPNGGSFKPDMVLCQWSSAFQFMESLHCV